MAKFKVGQWVRVLHTDYPESFVVGDFFKIGNILDHGVDPEGELKHLFFLNEELEPWTPRVGERVRVFYIELWNGEGEVYRNDGSLVCVMMKTGHNSGQKGGFRLTEIQPLPVAAQAQPAKDERADAGGGFKGGDKIRLVKNAIKGSRTIGKIYEAVARNGASASTSVNFKDDKGNLTWAPGEYFELHQPIQIETGKLYKTRDGRKVGPMVKSPWVGFTDGSRSVTSQRWEADGSFISGQIGNLDLVAEWIDQPASNDNAPVAVQPAAEAKPKFKVGDWVKNPSGWLRYYEVVKIEGDVFYVDASGQQMPYAISSHNWLVRPAVATPNPTAIVALIENGKPKPAATPFVHSSAEFAAKEAERLANKFKGKQFGVYVLSSTSEKAKPVYDHKWQQLAADGLKIDAIKELRGITGIGLKPAKDAVEYFLQAA